MNIKPIPLSWYTDKELERQAAVLYELEAACNVPCQAEAINLGRRFIQQVVDSRTLERAVQQELHDRLMKVNSTLDEK